MNGLLDAFRLFYHRRWLSEKKLQRYQLKKLNQLIQFAKKHSEYYQQVIPFDSISSFDQFEEIELLNKQRLMENFDTINTLGYQLENVMEYALSKEQRKDYYGYYQDRVVVGLSSGTSGNKGVYLTDRRLTKKLPFVFLARSGIPLKLLPYRISFFLRVFSQGFQDINSPLIKLQYIHTMSESKVMIEKIRSQRSNIIMGPPSLLRKLLPYKDELKKTVKLIVSYAEVLEKAQKVEFEVEFGAKVIEIYQASEGQMASACSYGNLHINEDLVYVELFDEQGRQVNEPNKVASMIITNLVNYVQPLIRYQMNDMIRLGHPCGCGSRFRVIDTIVGRSDDVFYFQNKQSQRVPIYPDILSRWIITATDNLLEFQVIQKKDGHMLIVMQCKDEHTFDIEVQKIRKNILEHAREYGIMIDVECKQHRFDQNKSSLKHKRFIRQKGD